MAQKDFDFTESDSSISGSNGTSEDRTQYISISDETRRRYLNYAFSVIQSRALPDIRDGLKPVQRRILYVMYQDLRLTANSKPRKCAKICGDTTGNYHPHGNAAVYDALVRLAQDFSLREPLIDGQGNFGSVMGLPAAADRYTEARLTSISEELMAELRYQTVDMRDNYDGSRQEPVVLPARFPNMLVNGSQGIAVGMATNIPPHNLGEVVSACVHLINDPEATIAQLMKYVKGPDFPLGGRIVTDRRDLRKVYETGRGPIKVRGEWKPDTKRLSQGRTQIIITSVPYNVQTGPLLSDIGNIIESRKIPQLLSVSDETNEELGLRVVLEIKSEDDAETVMAYLYKHTSLEQNFNFNSTCLVPQSDGSLIPAQVDLKEMLQQFLNFRFETVKRRLEFLLAQLRKRIHILEGFEIVFNGLDKALKIIRNSQGKQDAAVKLMKAFPLDEIQTNAVLEMQLYRISQLEIDSIREELKEKRAEADRLEKLLNSPKRMWKQIGNELKDLLDQFDPKRRTGIGSSDEIEEFDPQAYIIKENTNVVLTVEGWVKRVGKIQSVEKSRVRDGDSVLDVIPGSTVENVVFFASDGTAYTVPMKQIPASTGYGEPLSKHLKLADGVSIVAGYTTDARFTPDDVEYDDGSVTPLLFVATAAGNVLQYSLSTLRIPSTKAGRKYCRLAKGDRVVSALMIGEEETVFLASAQARIIHFAIDEVPVLSGPGRGVRGIKLEKNDEVLGATLLGRPSDCLRVVMNNGKTEVYGQTKYGVTGRGGKGVKTRQRTTFREIIRPEIELIDWAELEE